MEKVKKSDCAGCRNDFYNGNNPLSVKECWSFKDAKLIKVRDVHINLPPPYKHLPIVSHPDCYKRDRFVHVKPESLNSEGYWK